MRHAIIKNGLVTNVVLWDKQTDWTPPEGAEVVALDDGTPAGPGWTYDGTTFTPPPPEPELDDA